MNKELWTEIKKVYKKVGMTDVNFRRQKSDGYLSERWVVPLFLEMNKRKPPKLLTKLYGLTRNDMLRSNKVE